MSQVRKAGQPAGKSFLIFSVGLVAAVAGMIACSDVPTSSVVPQSAAVVTQEGSVGEGHNLMVDAVLRDVAKKRAKGSQKKLCKLAEEAAIEYARVTAKNPGYAVSLVKKQDFCAEASASRAAGIRASLYEEYALSARATQLLNSTNYLVSVSYSAGQLQSYLGGIDAAAVAELDSEEAEIVTSANSVAVSSFEYWNANLGYWQSTLTQGKTQLRSPEGFTDGPMTRRHGFWGDVWEVTKADLDGAISGGVGARLAKTAVPQAAMWIGGSKSIIKAIQLI